MPLKTLIGRVRRIEGTSYGFIETSDGPDHFFHYSDLAGNLDILDLPVRSTVEFESISAPKGLRAAHVRLVTQVQS